MYRIYLKQTISTLFRRIKQEIDEDYTQISLWYFVSFLFGCISFFSGIFCFSILQTLSFMCLLIILLLVFRASLLYRFILLVMLCFCVGIMACAIKEYNYQNALSAKIEKKFTALIAGDIEKITKLSQSTRVVLKNVCVLKSNIAQQNLPEIKGKVRIKIKDKYFKKIEIGERISIRVSLMPPPKKVIYGGYDFEFYAKINAIQAVGFSLSKPKLIRKSSGTWQGMQKKIYERLTALLQPISANFIAALIIGDSQGLDKKTMQSIRGAGISHILCISGLHLSFVTLFCFKFFRFWLNASNYLAYNTNIKVIAGLLSIIVSYCYLKLSGSQVSATRAFIMCSLASIAISLQRDYSPIRATAIASFLILLFDPEYVCHPSFQLSFLSVVSLIVGYGSYSNNAPKAASFLGKIKKDILANFYSSIFVGLTTGPIVAYHFHVLSNYSPIANVVAIPITTFILLPCAFIFLFLSIFGMDFYILKVMDYFIQIIVGSAQYITSLKYSQTYTGRISGESLVIYILGLFWLMIWRSKIRYAGALLIIASLVMMIRYEKPDLVLDVKKRAIGFNNPDDELIIYSDSAFSDFAKDYWALWFGKKNVSKHVLDNKQNIVLLTKKNKIVEVVFQNLDCNSAADLVINYSNYTCVDAKNIIQAKSLEQNFIFIWCSRQECYFRLYD